MITTANSWLLIIFFSFADGLGAEHQISVPLQRLPNRIHSQMSIAFGRCNLAMIERPPNKREVITRTDEPRGERVTEIVNPYVLNTGSFTDALPCFSGLYDVAGGTLAWENPFRFHTAW